MSHLHSLMIIHRDLKPGNVLVRDFGLSKVFTKNDVQLTKRIGTSYFMAPEVFQSSEYDFKCHVYSYAILICVILSERGANPFGKGISNVESKICNAPTFRSIIDASFDVAPKLLISLMKQCWNNNSKERPSFKKVIENFNGIGNKKIKSIDDVILENGNLKRELENLKKIIEEMKMKMENK